MIFYEMVTGVRPYDHPTSTVRIMAMHLTAPIPSLRQANPDLPPQLETVLQTAMAKEPADRYTTAQEMVTAIKTATAPPTPAKTVPRLEPVREPPTTETMMVTAIKTATAPPAPAKTVPELGPVREPPTTETKTKATPPEVPATATPVALATAPQPEPSPKPKPTVQQTQPLAAKKRRIPLWAWGIGGLATILLVVWGISTDFGTTNIPTEQSADASSFTPTRRPTATPKPSSPPVNASLHDTWRRPQDGMTMVYVPEGTFTMGSDEGYDDEKPVHEVYVDSYWIDQTEVTNGMYALCVQDGDCVEPSDLSSYTRDNYYPNSTFAEYPVIYVDWNDAQTYCEWAGGRLPTEAEWEKAARWVEETQEIRTFPWGEGIDCDHANYTYSCIGDTTAVGSYPDGISPYGALDMAGNVWEWTVSLYRPYPYDPNDGRENSNETGERVLRGGSWSYDGSYARAAFRGGSGDPTYRCDGIGFRCAQE